MSSFAAHSIPCTPVGTGRTSCMAGVRNVHDEVGMMDVWEIRGPGAVRANRFHPDHGSPMISIGGPGGPGGPGEFDLLRTRVRTCARYDSLTRFFGFVKKYPDHPDRASNHAGFSPDHHPDRTRTTRTTTGAV
jgi:hypothetical protein